MTVTSNSISTTNSGMCNTTIPPNYHFTVDPIYHNSSIIISSEEFINDLKLMENNTTQPQQVHVAIFEIERNEDFEIVSTKHVNTFWVEHKPKADLKLVVAKNLNKDVLDKIVIKELFRVSF